jgi:hypothetical protein
MCCILLPEFEISFSSLTEDIGWANEDLRLEDEDRSRVPTYI